MSSNKRVKEALIKRYGNKCFIERLHIRPQRGQKYKGCGQYKRMKQLTYHHILEKRNGGKATIENGALLSNENHMWFHKQSEDAQRIMNEQFQELKKKIDAQECKIEEVEEIDCPLDLNCLEIVIDKKGKLTAKILKEKAIREEKRNLQKLKKELEDR